MALLEGRGLDGARSTVESTLVPALKMNYLVWV
eukprot:CAMPEP_0198360410 /NCGR_PEP_ID=MMETSP1450-20131203/138325_1 /TAXON_ID=753684 ORGANISM="Madagascaria erythrocladiodes, Strain CCMP3234" /NCGR_SAMPLE_ID=MMETSP1450 /ASSEMBLY_ACC=CAM_ASM_001115 /LENGTH=32 /DNA_ID= /DNA_START= /DNA_END= /DNA_ORIENTATION=